MTKGTKSTEFKINCMQPYNDQSDQLGPSVLITWQRDNGQLEWVNAYKETELISEAEFKRRGGKVYRDPDPK